MNASEARGSTGRSFTSLSRVSRLNWSSIRVCSHEEGCKLPDEGVPGAVAVSWSSQAILGLLNSWDSFGACRSSF